MELLNIQTKSLSTAKTTKTERMWKEFLVFFFCLSTYQHFDFNNNNNNRRRLE